MKFRSYFMLAMAVAALTACTTDDTEPQGKKGSDRVMVTLTMGRTESRTLGVSAAGLYNNIKKLDVVFYNAAGQYVEAPETVETDATYKKTNVLSAAVEALNGNAHKTTMEIKGVPASASKIAIIANQKSINTSSEAEARKAVIYLSEQVSPDFDVFSSENSTMTGITNIVDNGDAASTATVQLLAVPSRIEFNKVVAVPVPQGEVWGGTDVKSFVVQGFYVNSFYTQGSLNPAVDDPNRNRIDNASDKEKYTLAAYDAAGWGFMCDEPTADNYVYTASDAAAGIIYTGATATSNYRWGHTVLQGDVPHVIVKLLVTYSDESSAVKFLTITNYKYAEASEQNNVGDHVAAFLRGHVYRLGDIRFDVTDLTDVPYEGVKTVTADVEVLPWVGVEVNPGFN